mmetsp:Transcript_130296/g.363009  ORF Transcript_130296/g.363009 Transcript_130296/m.363009 type:complete len:885 (+) Transcript_130296:32-2686(+)
MGCCNSSAPPATYTEPQKVSQKLFKTAHERLRKLKELDEATKVPFILVELTGEGDGQGEIEICGKDEYGVYQALDDWLVGTWGCTQLDAGDETEYTKIPFCSAQYEWKGFSATGDDGLNNMGLMIMRLVDFVAGQLSWTLAVVNGGNVGRRGEVREAQVVFKAPHPMNLVAPHMMIELRSAGFIEVNADLEEQHREVLDELDSFFAERFQAKELKGHETFCDRYYKAGEGVFRGNSGSGDSNFGLLTTQVCDKVVQLPGWSLVCFDSGSYGDHSELQEMQLVFRRDEHPLGDAPYLLAVLNSRGEVEVNGREVREVYRNLDKWFQQEWKCVRAGQFREGDILCRRYRWEAQDLMLATTQLITFFESEGWETQLCSQQMIKEEGEQCREQQILFRPGRTEVGTVEPHIFLEMYAGEGDEALYEDEETTQVLANQHFRICRVGPPKHKKLDEGIQALKDFIVGYLGGAPSNEEDTYQCNVFLCRGRFENNLAQWTMRICDFMVDKMGWSFIVCSLCNMGDSGQFRAQHMLFRFDDDKRNLPVSKIDTNNNDSSEWAEVSSPSHWQDPDVRSGQCCHKVLPCSIEEKEALQILLDETFRRVLTRDRHPDDDAPETEEMPYRLELVHAFRSEHRLLQGRIVQKREEAGSVEEAFSVKTSAPETCLTHRLEPGEAYLFHGTNPSSAMSILKTGFVLDHAGSTTGTMFGGGVYLAECSSKADEYGRDDGGNTYPSLNALLVCRCFVGKPYIVQSAGNHTDAAREQGFHCVVGDRETAAKTFREFIFFDEVGVYPEFSIIYRRQYQADKVPEKMRTSATGTTGRFWQIKVGRAWKNVPPEVNRWLLQAVKDDETLVEIGLHGTQYAFNVAEKTGLNKRTGNTVPLRPPMQS